jgi:XisH protein
MAKDIFHNHVKQILINDGWEITHDPFLVRSKNKSSNFQIDLGAEKLLAAEKGIEKIVVEVKSFLNESLTTDFHNALGQYLNYKTGLRKIGEDRILFLALPKDTYEDLMKHEFLSASIEDYDVKLLVYHDVEPTIILWKK